MAELMNTELSLEKLALKALHDLKAIDLVELDVRGLTTITDTMIICTGRSSRHVKSLAENVVMEAKKHQASFIHMEGQQEGEWVIVDLGDVVIHVMQAVTREFYNLEDLWEPHANTHTSHR
jgi:ribosome-associated protein